MIPPAKRGGRRREVNVREVLNAFLQDRDGALLAHDRRTRRFFLPLHQVHLR
jgi:hypothetical protein